MVESSKGKKIVLLLGTEKFGVPDMTSEIIINSQTNLDRLNRLAVAVTKHKSWAELLKTE